MDRKGEIAHKRCRVIIIITWNFLTVSIEWYQQ